MSLNRTFMELKPAFLVGVLTLFLRLNRTFMELKPIVISIFSVNQPVLIEPLWNWNKSIKSVAEQVRGVLIEPLWNWNWLRELRRQVPESLNRTFMELKLRKLRGL